MKLQEFQKIENLVQYVRISYALTDQTTYYKGTATTPFERLALRLKVKEMFANVLNDPELSMLETEYNKLKAKEEAQRRAREQQERRKWLEEYNRPINAFIRLLRSNYHRIDVSHIEELTNRLTQKQLEQLFKEYKERMRKNGLPLSNEAIDWGYQFLFSLLNKREPNKEKSTLWKKLKLGK